MLLIDESVRGDYIDWTPGNPFTPELARLKDRIVDFGPAASGGNCSHYSNAILRFGASQDGLGRKLLSTPTLWQYAKKAGFRTVFIDGQAGFNRNPGKLQNFMTAEEVRDIDGFYALDEKIAPPRFDDRLLDIVEQEIKSDKPVLIYANKNGAHFPYDEGYPKDAALFHPDHERNRCGQRADAHRFIPQRGALVGRPHLQAAVRRGLAQGHGRHLHLRPWAEPAARPLSHCSVEDPDPREGLVPLFAITGNAALHARLAAAAAESRGHGSHFTIVPTVLELLGFSRDIAKAYGAPLLPTRRARARFTSGDIFGLFAEQARRHPIDLGHDYLEPDAFPQAAAVGPHRASGDALTTTAIGRAGVPNI